MPPHYLRLRQVCLAARDAKRAERILTGVLGLSVAFRDERVRRYGLENMLLPLGTSFIEVVVPVEENTAVGRFLDRNQERRGYMLICDCDDLQAVRERAGRIDIRILHSRKWPRYENIQLHPRDTGATMMEFHHNIGGDELNGYYEPAGEHWQEHVRDDVSLALSGVELTSPEPEALARRWSELFDRPVEIKQGIAEIMLDNCMLRFFPGAEEDQVSALNIKVRNVAAILAAAHDLGCAVDGDAVDLCGVWFKLNEA